MNLSPINSFNPSPQDKIASASQQRNAQLSSTSNAQAQNNQQNKLADSEKSKSDSYTTQDSQSSSLNKRPSPEQESNKAPSQANQYKPEDKPITSIDHAKSQPKSTKDPRQSKPAAPATNKTWNDHTTEAAKRRQQDRGGQNLPKSEGAPNPPLEDTGQPSTPPSMARPEQSSPTSPSQNPKVPKIARPKFSAPPSKLPPPIKVPKIPRLRF